jgi:hypothetical protein
VPPHLEQGGASLGFGLKVLGCSLGSSVIDQSQCISAAAQLFVNPIMALEPYGVNAPERLEARRMRSSSLSNKGRQCTYNGTGPIGGGGLHIAANIISALDEGDQWAASLNVFEPEPLPETSPL